MPISKKWIPSIIAPAVVAAIAVSGPIQANAIDLPDRSPQELMVLMEQGKNVKGFTGIVSKESNLGLPSLNFSSMTDEASIARMEERMPEEMSDFVPQMLSQNALTEAVELIGGDHRFRIVVSDEGLRVQIMDPMNERVFVANEDEAWTYDYRQATATKATLPAGSIDKSDAKDAEASIENALQQASTSLALDLSDPQAIAEYLVEKTEESTKLEVGADRRIAGRDTYTLVAMPRSEDSLIESIEISIDSETGMVMQSLIRSTQQEEPALRIGFESIDLSTPESSEFSFTPPSGTTVTELPAPNKKQLTEAKAYLEKSSNAVSESVTRDAYRKKFSDMPMPEALGSDWDSVIKIPASSSMEDIQEALDSQFLEGIISEVDGGKMLSTPIMNVFINENGDVYMGAVTKKALMLKAELS